MFDPFFLLIVKHPEIKTLMGYDTRTAYISICMVLMQVLSCYYVQSCSWPTLVLAAYVWGGTINHSLSLAMHEISHNLAFGHSKPMWNRVVGMIVNLPIGLPASISFKKYHLEHHKYQGDEFIDTDIPTNFEGRLFFNTGMKVIWVFLQPLFYALRPMIVRPKAVEPLEVANLIVQVLFDFAIYHFIGGKALSYLLIGTILALGMHPLAGHFISEHYMFNVGYETYSYYGCLNILAWNVGYHNEHHDFPNIPGSRLPEVRKMAPEFYDDLPHHTSWVKVIYDFIMDPSIGPYARIKRENKEKKLKQLAEKEKESKQNNVENKKKLN